MRQQYVMFMGFVLAIGTLISLSFSGQWLGSTEVELANAFTAFKQIDILGIWSVTVPNVTFFFVGMRALMNLNFAFFQGDAGALIQWVLYLTVGLGLMWGIFTVVIGVIQGLFRR